LKNVNDYHDEINLVNDGLNFLCDDEKMKIILSAKN